MRNSRTKPLIELLSGVALIATGIGGLFFLGPVEITIRTAVTIILCLLALGFGKKMLVGGFRNMIYPAEVRPESTTEHAASPAVDDAFSGD